MSRCEGLHCPGCGDGKAIGAAAAIGAAVVLAVVVAEAAVWIAAVLASALAVAVAAAGYVAVRRRRRRTLPRSAGSRPALWIANPQASPPLSRQAPAIAPPAVVNVHIDAALLAGLFQAAQQAAVPVVIQSEREELP